ncbi:MAG TPA: hemerythrin domain-containing protein [Polyangiaceae bacterium LLY-WYZ-14_1]|jgi:hypothetical protein|nr:hemerythrin domain-containing protein [Polyangiaceae bacterium LLY-WYZ-14_1]
MELLASEVRARVLADHEALRKRLGAVDAAASGALAGQPKAADELSEAAKELSIAWARYRDLEDRLLVPALARADAWGEIRVQRLAGSQDLQRARVDEIVTAARAVAEASPEEAQTAAARLRELVGLLREELVAEERDALHPNLLKDDPVNILFTG